jgi:hypothetical protein
MEEISYLRSLNNELPLRRTCMMVYERKTIFHLYIFLKILSKKSLCGFRSGLDLDLVPSLDPDPNQ